jgi:selenocysteine-specific elongation factor
MSSIVIGTAGHIDHGKSSLVQALTGKDPDRLPEEKKRGITIDLGFADFHVGDVRVGFVDVPGHERFVKNMLAGVHGIDAVALVIAADEGVMPQTREHFDICRLLNVRSGLVVITKSDLVDDELMGLVRAEAEELVAGSFLEGAPIISASARTRAGLDDLRSAISEIAREIPARSSDFVARLPIDRVFTMKGFGAVVTGTLVSGHINEGQELELLPAGRRVRTRGVQVHGNAVQYAEAGQRTAVNLGGVDVSDIERGMMLAETGRLRVTQILDAEIRLLNTAPRPLRTRSRVRVHIGAAEVLARVKVLNNRGEITPGVADFAQLRLEKPVVALHDERFIIRSYSPSITIGGGVILDPIATKHRGKDLARTHQLLRALMNDDRATKFAAFVESAGNVGLRLSDIEARTGWTSATTLAIAAQAKEKGTVVDAEGVFVTSQLFEKFSEVAVEEVNKHHRRESLSRGLPRETLRERHFSHSPVELFRAVLADAEKNGILISEKDLVRSREHSLDLSPADVELQNKISSVYRKAGLEAPSFGDLLKSVGVADSQNAHAKKILKLLLDDGTLVRVQGEMFFHADALKGLKDLIHQYGARHEPERLIDVPTFKELAGISRKYAIPLLEYFDRERITRRAGDKRIIL